MEDLGGYYEGGWVALHPGQAFAGRALTAQFMPSRPDMAAAVAAEGKAEGRVSGTNSWVINELQMGDTMVADGYGKIVGGTTLVQISFATTRICG
jgi:regulator of RNase E activity RraA